MLQDSEDRLLRALRNLRPEAKGTEQRGPAHTLDARMAHCATPGTSIGLIEDFQVIWARGFGTRSNGNSAAVQPGTPFQAGSISKPVFALAVMKLAQEGKLDLDADVNGYLSSWAVPAANGWQPSVSLRQLLSHTAGTTVHGFPGYPAAGTWPTVHQVLDGQLPANTRPVVVDLLPGVQFRYSGGGTTIAQQVVVDVLDQPFPDLMRELVLDPLGMADSTFEQPLPPHMASRAAAAHPWNGVQTPGGWHVYPEMAAAGLWTTAHDLALLGADVMQTLNGNDSKLGLEQETVQDMLQPQLPDEKIGQQSFAGLGWFCHGEGQNFRFGHDGADEGFLSRILLVPARGQGAIVMINSIQGWPLIDEIFGAIRHEYDWPAFDDPPKTIATPCDGDFAGTYEDKGLTVTITSASDGFCLCFDNQAPLKLCASSELEFFATAIQLRVAFERNEAGRTESIAITQNNKVMKFGRKI